MTHPPTFTGQPFTCSKCGKGTNRVTYVITQSYTTMTAPISQYALCDACWAAQDACPFCKGTGKVAL